MSLNPIQGVANIAGRFQSHIQALATKAENGKEKPGIEKKYIDVTIQFIGATKVPKMEVIGTTDPYFHATLDQKISYRSSVQRNTLNPVWNEVWRVKNVPTTSKLSVELLDKDHRLLMDNYIGSGETAIYPAGAKEIELRAPMHIHNRGIFWLKVESTPSKDGPVQFPYLFDGPIHYTRHSSSSVGAVVKLRDARLYSTWKIYIKGVRQVFGDTVQKWNQNYKSAQTIFKGPASVAVRSTIHAGHRLLYMRSVTNDFGVIGGAEDVMALFRGGVQRSRTGGSTFRVHRIKPAVYTYVISTDDDTVRFSETGAPFFVDFASKHALHSNCAEAVWYSGEFHPRPAGGWQQLSDTMEDGDVEWELVIDNNSGTYSPDPELLPRVKKLVEMNFPGFTVVALRHDDPALKRSTDGCRAYAVRAWGVRSESLEPHVTEGEETLMSQVRASEVN